MLGLPESSVVVLTSGYLALIRPKTSSLAARSAAVVTPGVGAASGAASARSRYGNLLRGL